MVIFCQSKTYTLFHNNKVASLSFKETKVKSSDRRKWHLEWEEYFMALAFLSAQRSKDPKTKVRDSV